MSESLKVRENRARRAAIRQGMELQKSKRRDPNALDFGGYMLVHIATNGAVMGADPHAYSASLEQVEEWLSHPKRSSAKS